MSVKVTKKNLTPWNYKINEERTISKEINEVVEIFENVGLKNSPAGESVTNMSNNLDFLNQVNQMYSYIQLPIKLSGGDSAHGDLYVYSNGKRKFQPGETVSAILHLDLDNLGPLDVYVKMTDNNVKTNFYVADESVLDLIEAHIDI